MDDTFILIITAALSLIVGGIITSTFLKKSLLKKSNLILDEAREKAEIIKKEKILQAKEKFLQLKGEHEKVINEKIILFKEMKIR